MRRLQRALEGICIQKFTISAPLLDVSAKYTKIDVYSGVWYRILQKSQSLWHCWNRLWKQQPLFPHCPSSQEFRFTAGPPPLPRHQGEGTTLIWDGVPPTKPYRIDPCHHPGPLMEVPGIQTPPPLRHGRQVALYSSLEAAGLTALLFSPWDRLFGNIAGRCVQMSTF